MKIDISQLNDCDIWETEKNICHIQKEMDDKKTDKSHSNSILSHIFRDRFFLVTKRKRKSFE